MQRPLKGDFITEYIRNVMPATESPEKFHWWSAATIISSTLKRSTWVDRVNWKLYPNLYVVLVGRPGIGKGAAMNPVIAMLKEAGTSNILSDRITMEYVLEKLSKGFPKVSATGPPTAPTVKLGTESAATI